MVAFYEDCLGLPAQGELDFPGGTMKRYTLGTNVLKLVTLDQSSGRPAAQRAAVRPRPASATSPWW